MSNNHSEGPATTSRGNGELEPQASAAIPADHLKRRPGSAPRPRSSAKAPGLAPPRDAVPPSTVNIRPVTAWLVIMVLASTVLFLSAWSWSIKRVDIALYATMVIVTCVGLFLSLEIAIRLSVVARRTRTQMERVGTSQHDTTDRSTPLAATISDMSLCHSNVDPEVFLALHGDSFFAAPAGVRLCGDLLALLGLTGTLLGLVNMLSKLPNIAGQLGESVGVELLAELVGPGGPLGDLGLAFWSTVAGSIAGGLVLRLFAAVLERCARLHMLEVHRFILLHVQPESAGREGGAKQ